MPLAGETRHPRLTRYPKTSAVLLAALAAGLTILSHPVASVGWLAWFALVPLCLIWLRSSLKMAFAAAWLYGVFASFGIFFWMLEVPGFGLLQAIVLAAYLALYPALWSTLCALLRRGRLPILVTAPSTWIALDYLRGHADFLALPWASVAHSQIENLALLQAASVSGEYGLSFLVVLANVAIAGLLQSRRWHAFLCAAIAIALVHVLGAWTLRTPLPVGNTTVMAVQPSFLRHEQDVLSNPAARFARLRDLTVAAVKGRIDLIVWPETALQNLMRNPVLQGEVQALVDELDIPLILGSSDVDKFDGRDSSPGPVYKTRNSAYLFRPKEKPSPPYHKNILLPFGEYLPFADTVNWSRWLVGSVAETIPGKQARPFILPDGRRVAVLICWEIMFADYVRKLILDQSSLIVMIANDNWFGRSGAARQHNAGAILRAVEHRKPVIIASNTGPSQIISARGEVLAELPAFLPGTASSDIFLGHSPSVYTRLGDWPLPMAALFILVGLFWRRRA